MSTSPRRGGPSGGEEKKKPGRKRYDIPKTTKCHVCGDLAAEHLHYGGIACYSCRAFFRRTVNSNRPMLDCSGDKDCVINKETRKRCQWCRFEKCKSIGMKPSWVLSEDDKSKLQAAKLANAIKQEDDPVIIKTEIPDEEDDLQPNHSPASSPRKHNYGGGNITHPQSMKESKESAGSEYSRGGEQAVNQPPMNPTGMSPEMGYPGMNRQLGPYPNHSLFGYQDGYSNRPWHFPGAENQYGHPGTSANRHPMQKRDGTEYSQQGPSHNNKGFPFKNIQVSLSNPGCGDGVSFTIEALNRKKEGNGSMRPGTGGQEESRQGANIFKRARQSTPDKGMTPEMERCRDQAPFNWNHPLRSRSDAMAQGCSSNFSRNSINSNDFDSFNRQDPLTRHLSNIQQEDELPDMGNQDVESLAGISHSGSGEDAISAASQSQAGVDSEHNRPSARLTHQQHTRTIFRHVGSSKDDGSTSDHWPTPKPQNPVWNIMGTDALIANQSDLDQRTLIWKLDEHDPQDRSDRNFLKENLFLEQLAAIDERIRFQVPMDIFHGRAIMDSALTNKKIVQSTIMHAYQICIKRSVRFANSLQDFTELPSDDMQKLLVANALNMINVRLARWFHPETSLESQLNLCGTGVDLYKEVTIQHDLDPMYVEQPVKLDDIFSSPWCCDSVFEDRYVRLMNAMHQLPMDNTIVVLLSIMTLFDPTNAEKIDKMSFVKNNGNKFFLLLTRYLIFKYGQDRGKELITKFQETLGWLREMSDILINKRLIC